MRAPRKVGGRMKPETEGARPKPSVCRRLFADDDVEPADQGLRDNMFNQITEQINRNLDDACKKYNFDFRTEQPLEGDWTWERMPPEGDADATDDADAAPQVEVKAVAVAEARGEPEGAKGAPPLPPTTPDSQETPSVPH